MNKRQTHRDKNLLSVYSSISLSLKASWMDGVATGNSFFLNTKGSRWGLAGCYGVSVFVSFHVKRHKFTDFICSHFSVRLVSKKEKLVFPFPRVFSHMCAAWN